MLKRILIGVITSIVLLGSTLAIAAVPLLWSHRASHATSAGPKFRRVATITGLDRLSLVGSTAFIVDAKGKTITTDANPYGVAIAPHSTPSSSMPGSLRAGDIVVTNFGGMETGMTLVRFPAMQGPGHILNTMANPGTKGPAMEAFNTGSGTDWVANTSGNNVQIFTPQGKVLATITSPLFNRPWGQAFNNGVHNRQDGAVASFFSTNATDGAIDRIDVIPAKGILTFKVYQIGQLAHMGKDTFIAVTWIPSLQIRGRLYSDVLLATDPVNNRIAAYPHSSTINTTKMRSTSQGMTVFQGNPLQTPAGLTINPSNGDLLVTNMMKNNLVELNISQGRVVGTRVLDNVPVDPAAGTGSALFGVAATTDSHGNLEVFFTDDNTNTLDVLSV